MRIKHEIIKRAKEALQDGLIDAITLSLHGSIRVKKQGEVEGFFSRRTQKNISYDAYHLFFGYAYDDDVENA